MICMRRAGCRLRLRSIGRQGLEAATPRISTGQGVRKAAASTTARGARRRSLRGRSASGAPTAIDSISKLWRVTDLAGPDAGVGRGVTGAGAKKVVSPQVPLEWSPPSPRAAARVVSCGVPRACPSVAIYREPVRVDLPGPLRIPERRLRIDLESRHVRAPLGLPEDASLPHGSVPEDFDGRG